MYEYKSLNMTFPPVAVMGGDKDTYLEEGEDGESNPSSQMLIPLLKLAQCFQSGKWKAFANQLFCVWCLQIHFSQAQRERLKLYNCPKIRFPFLCSSSY